MELTGISDPQCGFSEKTTSALGDLTTGIVYKNTKPHVRSVHAYFPSVAASSDGELLATYVLGEAFEATNLRTHLTRSRDGGKTWRHEGVLYPGVSDRILSDCGRIAIAPDGETIVNLMRYDRTQHPDEGLANPRNMGMVPTEAAILRSANGGLAWTAPAAIQPPLVGPCFELCSPITFLRDGRWLLPTATWLDWNGNLPNGNRMVAFVSSDRGHTWPAYLDVMHSEDDSLFFWESKIVELSDGRLLAVAWCHDHKAKADRPNQYAISSDGGATWSTPRSTGLLGQTLTPCLLADGRLLCVYRRMDRPGLWANVSRLDGDCWFNEACQPLWGHRRMDGHTACEDNMVDSFHKLNFGAPSIVRLRDNAIFVLFWCYEDNISVIRWFRFNVHFTPAPRSRETSRP